MMRPLVFDFPGDNEAMKQQTEFMFGPSQLVCPVTEQGIKSMRVYLPKYEAGWKLFDSTDSKIYNGGAYVEVPVTIDRIPVFVKADHKINLK
jgi:alpha-D-xyloside xylohydrolase